MRPHGTQAYGSGKRRAGRGRSKTERPVSAVVTHLNPVLRGWAVYFRNGNSGRKFNAVDGHVSGWRSSPAGNMAEQVVSTAAES